MDIEFLRTFLDLAQTRHFGHTSERLFVTQSAVSARIKQLEDILGVKLFLREPRDVQITTAGRRLVPYASTIVSTWTQARMKVAVEGNDGISVSIGAVGSLWDAVLQDWFNQSCNSFPNISFSVHIESNGSLLQNVTNGSLDVVFLFDPITSPSMCITPITDVKIRLYTTLDISESYESILKSRYILVDWGTQFIAQHDQLLGASIIPHVTVAQGRIALNAMLQTGGSAYLPEQLVYESITTGLCRQVTEATEFTRQAFAVYNPKNHDHLLINSIIENLSSKDSGSAPLDETLPDSLNSGAQLSQAPD